MTHLVINLLQTLHVLPDFFISLLFDDFVFPLSKRMLARYHIDSCYFVGPFPRKKFKRIGCFGI